MPNPHLLKKDIQMGIRYQGKEHYIPAIPYPMFVTTGLPIWKRFNEKNWRPQCVCSRIFDTMEDYEAHIVYKNSLWGLHDGIKTTNYKLGLAKEKK